MSDEIEYERTEYDRISPAVADRYRRISRERGRRVVPLDVRGLDEDGVDPFEHPTVGADADPEGAAEADGADAGDGDSPVAGRRRLGLFGGRSEPE